MTSSQIDYISDRNTVLMILDRRDLDTPELLFNDTKIIGTKINLQNSNSQCIYDCQFDY